jgi:hypothetical protein
MVKNVLLAGVFAFGVLAMPSPALAGVDDGEAGADPEACATNLVSCYEAAAKIDSFWYRWAAGIDCELKFVKCTRQMLLSD